MLRIAAVDGDPSALERLQQLLAQYQDQRGISAGVSIFRKAEQLLEHYRPVYDVIFLEIGLSGMNGVAAAERIRQLDQNAAIIFLTHLAQYAIQGYRVGALDFLLKPADYPGLSAALDRAVRLTQARPPERIVLAQPGGAVQLEVRQIYYGEIQDRHLHYHTDQGEYILRGSMRQAEQQLKGCRFVRCNYWYLVNLYHVTAVKKDVVVAAGHELTISRRCRSAFLAALAGQSAGRV